jgi:hypothetical protein
MVVVPADSNFGRLEAVTTPNRVALEQQVDRFLAELLGTPESQSADPIRLPLRVVVPVTCIEVVFEIGPARTSGDQKP